MSELSIETSKSAFEYLQQATAEIAKEKKFTPKYESQLMVWVSKTSMIISERAGDLQQAFIAKVLAEEKTISPALSTVVCEDLID
jgi:hypothetical protein